MPASRTNDYHFVTSWTMQGTCEEVSDILFAIAATGDFEGTGRWTFLQRGSAVDITFDWRIRAEKPLLRWLSFLLKPIFEANHRWAMARGEESLAGELSRWRGRPPRSSSSAGTTTR